jgi:2-polyprenyl-3-methyl-5-hydroxy-6-metoxy-1,4-benzoquinol methylase
MEIIQGLLNNKRPHIARRLQILSSLLKDHDEVLDIGCGIGSYITDTLGYLPIKITAIDYDSNSIEYAKHHNQHKNVEYFTASGESYRADKCFDVVVCSHVLEHCIYPEVLLKNVCKLMTDRGRLYLALPNGYGCFEIENFIPRQIIKTNVGKKLINMMMCNVKDTLNHENPHVHFFNIQRLNLLLVNNGFNIDNYYKEQLIGGVITDRTILKLPYMERFNIWLGDRLPVCMANGWIIVCHKR